ncbi:MULTISPECIES: helix-turn-helix domain-containing protein [Mumia]|uniref:PucR family transcriptional regulator n=1 Tax=Mumia TaxID=1546255 RepID=UPI00141E4BAC|nr:MULTISPECIES: helix-turn-helix domain-containing protein [unclassified Mumia]QMW67338.1 helix-turn-helix domain-containing protein [Mumia sp. ZJ1417]
MIEMHGELGPPDVPATLVNTFKPHLPALVARITDRIQEHVPAYAGPAIGRRHKLISMAVNGAIKQFVDLATGKSAGSNRVDDLFRQMGYGEAAAGHDLSSLRSALKLGTREAWDELRALASGQGLSADLLGRLGDILFTYIDHLTEQVGIGYEAALQARERDVNVVRARLLASILKRAPADEIETLSTNAAWPLPARFVVFSADARGEVTVPDLAEVETSILGRIDVTPALFVCASDATPGIIEYLRGNAPGVRIAMSWPVSIDEVPDARRWTIRTLELADQDVIPNQAVLECEKHRTQIWLHAEPALRRRLTQELLRPLLAETQNSREILSETLLAWLESRDSAPAIAARLGVHPQTVRYRWKRINELFGEKLHDSEFVVQLTMLLKASVPLWVAGDQSDFERFLTEDAR